MTVRAGLLAFAKPGLITRCVFVAGGEIPFRAIKDVANVGESWVLRKGRRLGWALLAKAPDDVSGLLV
jgi:hypothetical protein